MGWGKGSSDRMFGTSQPNQAMANSAVGFTRSAKAFNSRTVTLEPGATKQVALGSYFVSDPKPQFEVTTSPADLQDHTGASLELIDIPGSQKYIAFYHLHNFSDKICDITIAKQN